MFSLARLLCIALAAFVILAPRQAPAQTVAQSFGELRQVVRKGETVIVTDATGQRTKGKVADVSPSSLVVLIPETRTFAEGTITEVRSTDSVRSGAIIGASIGAGLALWDYLIDPSEPDNAVYFAVAIGLGAAIGAGIDALVGGKLLYGSPRRVRLSPIVAKDSQGVLVTVRF